MKKVFFTLLILGSIATIIYLLLHEGYLLLNYPSDTNYPVKGIDISHHQGRIDWEKIASNNVHFVYMKSTEGGNFTDSLFVHNWLKSREKGIVTGAYHFFTFCKPGKEQAYNYIQAVPKMKHMLPPAIDVEYGGNCKLRPEPKEFAKELSECINIIRHHYQQDPILYITEDIYEHYIRDHFDNQPLWIRNVYHLPQIRKDWMFWQYSGRGRMDGIDGPVDLNVFAGSKKDFLNFYKSRLQTSKLIGNKKIYKNDELVIGVDSALYVRENDQKFYCGLSITNISNDTIYLYLEDQFIIEPIEWSVIDDEKTYSSEDLKGISDSTMSYLRKHHTQKITLIPLQSYNYKIAFKGRGWKDMDVKPEEFVSVSLHGNLVYEKKQQLEAIEIVNSKQTEIVLPHPVSKKEMESKAIVWGKDI